MPTSTTSSSAGLPQPARRSWLKRLSGLMAGSFLVSPLQALLGRATPATAGTMTGSDPFVGEIIIGAFNFPPRGYALCNGQLLPISQNTALFSLLGTMYGGDGRSTFALPDLQGCVPIGAGQSSASGTYYNVGETGGEKFHTLSVQEIPAHSHTMELTYSTALGTTDSPANAFLASNASGFAQYDAGSTGATASGPLDAAMPHNNMQPYLTLGYYIALQGIFPPRQ